MTFQVTGDAVVTEQDAECGDTCHHAGNTDYDRQVMDALGRQNEMVVDTSDGSATAVDLWSVTERATGNRRSVAVLRTAYQTEDGVEEHVIPIAMILNPEDIGLFDAGLDVDTLTHHHQEG